jgi:hypothetical protein
MKIELIENIASPKQVPTELVKQGQYEDALKPCQILFIPLENLKINCGTGCCPKLLLNV